MRKIIVGLTGASGSIYGYRLLEALSKTETETHVIASKWAQVTLEHETNHKLKDLQKLADHFYGPSDMGAPVSSGSFETDSMVIAPCSARSMAAIANGFGEHLVHRAADVILKERRKLILAVRETPFSEIHLENMLKLARLGIVILPPVTEFYTNPTSIDAMVDHIVGKCLDQFDIEHDLFTRWGSK